VAVEPGLLLLRELPVGIDLGRVLDGVLVERDADALVANAGVLDRDERALGPEQPRVDERPLGLVRLGVEVDLLDRADLLSIRAPQVLAAVRQDVLRLSRMASLVHSGSVDLVWRPRLR
jgi:hypothetical protein